MSKKMLINATLPEEDRVAIVEDGILTELDIEIAGRQQTKSNIYKGEVIRVEQGLQAAFVDYGAQRPGFLQIGEIHPSLYPKRDDDTPHPRRPAITDILKRGQQILVQVVKEERGNKGAALTTEISLPGRYMVLMPESSSRGISRKIDNDSVRKGIKQTMAGLELPENMGYIIRTAAIDQPAEELKRDFDYLLNTYNSIISHNETAKAPSLIYQESNLVIRSIRDYFSTDIDEVLIDDRTVFQEARDFFKAVMPEHASLVKLHQERRPIFSRYQIEEQISQLSSNTVNLPSGGSIVLDQTEALVAIDVNSGKMSSEQDVEATAHRVNLEAAVEVARQLRLRDMGGLIVIDFIDMRQRKNAREVEKALKTSLKIDKARVTVGRISHQFGLLEMSRQRIKANLGEGAYRVCSHCQGKGRIQSEESCSVSLLRQIQASTAKGNVSKVLCKAAVDVANYLHNNKRRELHDLEQRYNLTISITADSLFLPEQTELEVIKQSQEQKENRSNTETAPLVDMDMSLRGQSNENTEENPEKPSGTKTDTTTTEETSETSADSQETTERKRPRRRRRSNRRRPDQKRTENTSSADSTDDKSEPSSAEESTTQPKTTEVAATETNSVSSASTEIATPTTTEENKTVPPVADAAETNKQSEDIIQDEPAKKPARRRRAPAKKSTPKPEENTDDTVKDETANTEPATEKPKRRAPRRKAAPKVTEAENNEQNSDQPSTPITKQQEEPNVEPEKKPVRRRRTTKKADEATESATTESVSASPEEEVKPKRRAPRKKATQAAAKDTTATAEATQTDARDSDSAAEESVEKKPTRRRRTTKKAPETTTAEVTVTQTADETVVTEKPKRPVRRRSTVEKPATTTVENTDEKEAEIKKPVRRRTPRKAVAKEEQSSTEEKKPKKKTSTAKKASPEIEDKPIEN
ncbi:MAG: hypothetical protein BA874_04660 [Desulfuromonadales bacterium C00003068]|jgi:ribonuclease E|nr:MAG: hypothetical protein BA874_04660 [Desulfuromonadales bacterium C00003068]